MSRKLKVAVIGVGYLGRIHAKIYKGMADVDLVAVCDIDSDAVHSVAGEFACDAYTDANVLVDEVDAVSIVVPTSFHYQVAAPFLENGVDMMLEKPLASDVEQSRQLVELAESKGVILQVGHLERFNAGVMKLAEMCDDPRFIEVHRLGTFVERATDVDVVTDLMIHDIDIVLSLVNSELKSVRATGTAVVTNHVDIANARLEFENGAVANVTASRVSRNQFRRIRVFSSACYLGLNFADQQVEEVRPGKIPSGARFPELISRQIEIKPQKPLDAELEHFVDCVRRRTPPLVSGRDGLLAVDVASRVHQSMMRGNVSDTSS